jgi:hypothetical protein
MRRRRLWRGEAQRGSVRPRIAACTTRMPRPIDGAGHYSRRGNIGVQSLQRLWAGDLPLGQAFWTWAVAGGLAVNVTTSLLFLALVANDRLVLAFLVGYACSIPYNVVALVGVWRSADRYAGNPALAGAARIVASIGLLLLSLT